MDPKPVSPDDELMTPAEVARLFRVRTREVTRWAAAGRFPEGTVVRTPGGHRRYRETAIRALLNGQQS